MRGALRSSSARASLEAARSGTRGDVDVDRVEKAPVGGMVRARALAVLGEQRVQRIDADDAAAGARGGFAEQRQRGEVADALVAAPAQRIKMRGEPEAACRRREAPGAGGSAAAPGPAQRPARAGRGELEQAVARLAGRVGGEPHRRQQRALGVGADDVAAAGEIPPFAGDARGRGEPVEQRRFDAAPAPGAGTRRFGEHHHRPRRDFGRLVCEGRRADGKPGGGHGRGGPVRRLRGPAQGRRRVDRGAPAEALARFRPAHGDGPVAGVERDGDPIGRRGSVGARVEDRHQRAAVGVRPVVALHRLAIRTSPLDVGDAARVGRRAGEPAVGAQRRVAPAQIDQRGDAIDETFVGGVPVDPGQCAVLRVGIVVAALRAPELVAHRQHRRAARQQQRGEQVADVARAAGANGDVGRRALDAVIPGMVGVGAVAVVLAVRLVVLGRVGDEVGEREAVVRGDEVDRPRRRPRACREDIGRAGETGREFAREARVAAPEAPHRVAIAVVPFAPGRRKRAQPVPAGPDVPRLGDRASARAAPDPARSPAAAAPSRRSRRPCGRAWSRGRSGSRRRRRLRRSNAACPSPGAVPAAGRAPACCRSRCRRCTGNGRRRASGSTSRCRVRAATASARGRRLRRCG